MAYIKHEMISDVHAKRLINDPDNAELISIIDEKTDQRIRSRCLDLKIAWENVPKMDPPDDEIPLSDALKAWGECIWLKELFESAFGGVEIDDIYDRKIKMYHFKSQDLRREVTYQTIMGNSETDFSKRAEPIPVY